MELEFWDRVENMVFIRYARTATIELAVYRSYFSLMKTRTEKLNLLSEKLSEQDSNFGIGLKM
jgi:hypothetical protein